MKKSVLPRLFAFVLAFAFLLATAPACSTAGDKTPAGAKTVKGVKGLHVVYLTDGNEYWGMVDRVEKDRIHFTHVDGKKSVYETKDVKNVTFQKKRLYHEIEHVSKLPDKQYYSQWKQNPYTGAMMRMIEPYRRALEARFNSLVLRKDVRCELAADGSATIETRIVKFILKEEGKSEMIDYFTYRKDREKGELVYALTVNPDGSVHHIKDDAINDEPLNNEVAEYDRLHRIKFGLPNVGVHSILDYAYRVTISKTDPTYPFILEHYFLGGVPVLEQSITVTTYRNGTGLADDFDPGKFREWPIFPGLEFYPKLAVRRFRVRGGGIRYVYKLGPIGGFMQDEYKTPPFSHFTPQVVVGLKTDWAKVGAAYAEKLAALEPALDKAVKKLGVLRYGTLGREIAEEAYDRIARKMKHVPVGMGGYDYLPQDPGPLVKKDIANSLDKAHLFLGICKLVGIKANLVLVRGQGAGPVAPDVANIRQLTTPLVRVMLDGKPVYCAFGSVNLRFGQIPSYLQDVRGLLIDGKESKLVQVPPTPPADQAATNKVSVLVKEDGSVEVTRVTTLTGGVEESYRTMRFSPVEKIRKDIEASFGEIHPNCEYKSHRFITGLDDFSKPLEVEYKYEISDYTKKGGDRLLLLRLPELSYSAGDVGRQKRRLPFYFGVHTQQIHEYTVTLPPGFRVRYTPDNIDPSPGADTCPYTYIASFREEGNKLIFTDRTENTSPSIPNTFYGDLKTKMEARAKLTKKWIILERGEK
ncbi:MAG: DUF3857 domain-containing protein [Planctomycetota bacterium]|nr:MAG: DUF3857 domain-containing protein [Planctomycetota bacterium]